MAGLMRNIFVDFKNYFSEDLLSLKDEEMMTKKYAFLAFALSSTMVSEMVSKFTGRFFCDTTLP